MPAKEHRNQLARNTMIMLALGLVVMLLFLTLLGMFTRQFHKNGYVWKGWWRA